MPNDSLIGKNEDDAIEINLVDFLYVIMRRRKFLVWFVGIVTLLTLIVMFAFVTRYYEGKTTVMPSKQKSQFSASSLMKNVLPFAGFGTTKSSEDLALFTTILNSRNSYDRVIEKFNLMDVYDIRVSEDAAKKLSERVEFSSNSDDNALEIKVFDPDSSRAKAMAGYFVTVLNDIYIQMNSREARNNREFIQRRYEQLLLDLKSAEDSLRAFQERYGVYTANDQVKAAIIAAAELEAKIALREIELGVLEKTMTATNPELEAMKTEVAEFKKRRREMTVGGGGEKGTNIFIPFAQVPERAIEYIRVMREVEIQTKLQETLLPLFEQSKIEENRDTPTVVVLDPPTVSSRPVKPRRLIITAIVALVGFFVGIFLIFVRDFLARMREKNAPIHDGKLAYIMRNLKPRNFISFDK